MIYQPALNLHVHNPRNSEINFHVPRPRTEYAKEVDLCAVEQDSLGNQSPALFKSV